jgi:small subunit ribosomal protein S16
VSCEYIFKLITHHSPLITKFMLAISLMRMGAKGKPFYRLVVKEKRSKRDGKYLENLGTYNPMIDPAEVTLDHERIQYWIGVGAQPSDTVRSLIKNNPIQTEEERAAAIQARADKKAASEAARAEAKKAEAEKREAERLEAEKVKAEAAAAEAAEAEASAPAEAEAEPPEAEAPAEVEATAAETVEADAAPVDAVEAEVPVEAEATATDVVETESPATDAGEENPEAAPAEA